MKSAQSESVGELGPHASSVKVSLAQDVNKQPQKAMDCADTNELSWILITCKISLTCSSRFNNLDKAFYIHNVDVVFQQHIQYATMRVVTRNLHLAN